MYLSAVIGLLTTMATHAQVLYGVQGSFQSSNVALGSSAGALGGLGLDLGSMFKARLGFRAGVMADIPVTDRLSVRPQLLYSVKGYKVDPRPLITSLLGGFGGGLTDALPDSLVQTMGVSYLEVPVQVMYGLDAGPGRVVIGAGPYVAYALSGSLNGKAEAFSNDAKRLDYGANLSLGYELPMGLTLSAYYSLGFANLTTTPQSPPPTDPDVDPDLDTSAFMPTGSVSNRSFGFTIGYFFGTGN